MPPISRRTLLEGTAATLGLSLVGCATKTTETGPLQAKVEGPKIVLTGAKLPDAGEALAFILPGGEPALLFQNGSDLVALNAICTHSGCTVEWIGADQAPIRCPCHESLFRRDGSVVSGPANEPLSQFRAKVEGETIILSRVG